MRKSNIVNDFNSFTIMYLRIESFVPFETILNNSIEHFAFSILTEAGIYFLFVVVAPPIFSKQYYDIIPNEIRNER